MKKTYYLMYLTAGLLLAACNKEEEEPVVTATLSLTSPHEGDTIHQYDTLHISGNLSADGSMHGYKLTIRKSSNDSIMFTESVGEHGSSYPLNVLWKNYLSVSDHLLVKVEATTGHDGETQVFQRQLVLAP